MQLLLYAWIKVKPTFSQLRAVHLLKCYLFSNQRDQQRQYKYDISKSFIVN